MSDTAVHLIIVGGAVALLIGWLLLVSHVGRRQQLTD